MSKVIDLTNRNFGKLTVIKQFTERSKNNYIQWVCICECTPTIERVIIGKYL